VARFVGKAVEPSEQIPFALMGFGLGVLVLAVAGIPFLVAGNSSSLIPTKKPAVVAPGTPLSSGDAKAVQRLVRTHYCATNQFAEVKCDSRRGQTFRIEQTRLMSLDQISRSGDRALANRLREAVAGDAQAPCDDYAMAIVDYTATPYVHAGGTGGGAELPADAKTYRGVLSFGKQGGSWYELSCRD